MAAHDQNLYKYLPIAEPDGIRLIVLEPSKDKAAPVHCSIIHTSLRHAREEIYDHYTALSYVWGDANDTVFISVDGHRLQVTKSLECALRHLRDAKRILHVWADGVCINQQDNGEKGQQVQQMGQVYEVAHHSVIFLGESDGATEAGLAKMLHYYDQGALHPDSDAGIQILKKILARPWFYRIWILQELVMSRDPRLQLGGIRFPWSTLSKLKVLFSDSEAQYEDSLDLGPKLCFSHRTKRTLGDVSTSLAGAFEVVKQMNNAKWIFEQSRLESRYETEEKPGKSTVHTESFHDNDTDDSTAGFPKTDDAFLSIMEGRRGYPVSDSRDRVFAHLGLIDYLSLVPDYGMTYQQVFETFAQKHISVTNSVDIFSYVEDIELEMRMHGLPSWVPDWTQRQENPRYRILTQQASINWYEPDLIAKNPKESGFGPYRFQGGGFTSKIFFLASIKKLGRVLDTSSYEGYGEEPFLEGKKANVWLHHQSRLDLPAETLPSPFLPSFVAHELDLAKEGRGSLLDGRRLAVFEAKQSDEFDYRYTCSFGIVPASSKEGDLIYCSRKSALALVLRPLRGEHSLPKEGNRALHLIGVCLSDVAYELVSSSYGQHVYGRYESAELITIF